jgi:glycosyltransferase involved in cell wall biosynthesis
LETPKHILLVSYVFPPYYGIGGRRWAKHASELTKLGYVVHVICAKNPFEETSLWWDLVKDNPNIRIYELPRMYPKVLVKFEHHFFQKILYKFWVTLLPMVTKGSSLDRTIFWKATMLRKAKELIIKHQINHVICSGGPFGAMYQVTELRKWFNNLFILNDLRDPWTWGPNWGFPDLEPKRMAYELSLESKAIENADLFSTPSLDMSIYLKNKYPQFKDKFIHIPHFFDPEEAIPQRKTSSDKIRLVMYGNIYHNIGEYVTKLAELMSRYGKRLSLDIYTDKQQHRHTFKEYQADNVRFFEQLEAKELFKKFADYDYVLLFNPSYNINNISTKFFEIISTKTPIILFCEKGLGSDFIVNNHLGLHADLASIEGLLEKLANGSINLAYNMNYDIRRFSLSTVTHSISDILLKSRPFVTSQEQGKPRKDILITFDYELFLGARSGTVDNCMIKPTNQIIHLLEKQHIKKALFFVDTIYLTRLSERSEEPARKDYAKIMAQLCLLLKKGHLIFPHIHPHWLDARYESSVNQWELTRVDKYRFHNIDEKTRNELFEFSMALIRRIQEESQVFYDIAGYRAGGWCLQPFSDFSPFFKKHGIRYDFSVLKNFKNLSPDVFYNYTKVPRKATYRFNEFVETEDANGPFKEYSISYIEIKHKLIHRLFSKYLAVRGINNLGDGVSVKKTEEQIMKDIDEGLTSDATGHMEMVSVELLKTTKLNAYKKLIYYNTYTHFISHPKMLSSHNLKSFDKLLTHIQKNYHIQTDYELMS